MKGNNDVRVSKGLRELHLFAGAGGGILGGILLGHTCVCAVEIEPYCRKVLFQRQWDGILPKFPIWDDVRTFDGKPWRGLVDVVCGGFPCQDISAAGKGKGIDGERSGLWGEMARIIGEVRPRKVFIENSPRIIGVGLNRVLEDLSSMGFNAKWGNFTACSCSLPQERNRFYSLADSMCWNRSMGWDVSRGWRITKQTQENMDRPSKGEPPMVGVVDGLAYRMDQLKAIGNGQVPAVVKLAWEILSGGC